MRSGVIAKKIGMTRLFMEDGKQVPVTVLQMENLQVVSQRTNETDGYTAVQLGAGVAKAKRQSAAMRGHFAKAKVEPKRKIAEFRVSADNLIEVGEEIVANCYTKIMHSSGESFSELSSAIHKASISILPKRERRHSRWFYEK